MTARAAWAAGCLIALAGAASVCTAGVSEPRYSAAELYNQANAYERAGKPGLAVLNYERAALLAPDDPDIGANLRYAQLKGPGTPAPSAAGALTAIKTIFMRGVTMASPNTMSWLALVGSVLLGAATITGSAWRAHRWARRGAAALGIILLGLMSGQGLILWPALHSAVVMKDGTEVRVSPVPMGDPMFTLPEAAVVAMTSQHDEFVLIRTATGRTGWVARASIAPVVP